MLELLLLAAIAYAGARGVEKLAGTPDRRHASKDAETTVAKVAARGPKDGSATTKPEKPGPTEPGGTFSAASPRSAQLGGKAAVPLAVITETSATIWKATLEGYRGRWPEIREERRRKMAERAATRKTKKEEAEAKKKAEEAAAKAGPPPPYPPKPTDLPKADGADAKDTPEEAKGSETDPKSATAPDGTGPDETVGPKTEAALERERAEREAKRAEKAEAEGEAAKKDAREARDRAATDKVLAAQKAEREAKEREAATEERARAAEAKAAEAKPADPASAASPDGPRHLAVVPDPTQNGDLMSSPATVIPEIRTLDGLMNALTLVKAMCEMRSEEAIAIAADDLALSNRLDQIESEMAEMEVDDGTRAEIDTLRESIHAQSQHAAQYGSAAKDVGDFAVAAAAAAYRSHGGIAEAVQSSPIDRAAQAGHYDR